MNKQSIITILLIVLMSMIGFKAFAYDFAVANSDGVTIYYEVRSDNTVAVTSGNVEYTGNIVIPNQVTYLGTTYSVTSIGDEAFSGCSGLTSITIPNSVTSIGYGAFNGTAWFNNQPEGLVYVGKVAYNYKGEMPANTQITIKEGTLGIADYAFFGCSGLASITIPNSVTSIGRGAFSCCSGLTSITIPNSVTSIGGGAFSNCSGLTSITIPNSVTSIDDVAFGGCNNLASVISQIKNPFDINENAFDYSTTILAVPSGTKSAYLSKTGWKKFSNIVECEKKRTIHVATAGTLPSLINDYEKYLIEELALTGELNGTDIRFIRNMAGIDYGKKYSMSDAYFWDIVTPGRLNKLDISNVDIVNGGDAYYGEGDNGGDEYWSYNNSISGYMFYGCSSLTSITIPNSVTSINPFAFYNCNNLVSIIVENNNQLFDSRNNCNAIIEKSSNTLIVGCKNTVIPNSVISIDWCAFYRCRGLTSVTIPNSVTSIGSSAFSGCSGLTSVTIPNSMTSIGNYALGDCGSLKTVISGIENPFAINNSVFNGIPSNAQLIVPKGKKSVYQATAGWNQFTNIVEAGGVGYKFEADGIYYKIGENNTVSVTYGDTKYSGDVVIPSQVVYEGKTYSVKSIGVMAFYECSELTSITIPNSVKSIDDEAFNHCSGLTSITIPESVKGIGWRAFYDCGLTSITILGSPCMDAPFGGPLTAVHISDLDKFLRIEYERPWDLNDALNYAHHLFLNGEEIKDLVIPNTITKINDGALSGASSLTSVTIPNSVTSIGGLAFHGCSCLTSLSIPNSVTSIGQYAFRKCSGLTSITIPNSVISIGYNAFRSCSSLTSVIVGKGVQSIVNAFDNCNNLQEMILSQTAYENGIPESVTKFTTYSKDPMRVVVLSKGATSATMKIYPIDDSGNTNEGNCYTVTMQGLTPGQYIKWKLDDENYGIISEKTEGTLTLMTQPAHPTSTTKARLIATVNEVDDDQHYGFEWLRYGTPESMPPNKVYAPLYNGQIMGSLSGLNPDIYYNYRPFYKSDSGEMVYGEWVTFLTGDANVFFEPETHTKEASMVTDVSAQLAGIWIEGTEDIQEKGFEYWTISKANTRAAGSDVKTIIVSGKQSTVTIEGLVAGKEYSYRTYVKTASDTTYGEEKTFRTILLGDVDNDGELTNSDADAIAKHIIGQTPPDFNMKMADVNEDGYVNVIDIVCLTNMIE